MTIVEQNTMEQCSSSASATSSVAVGWSGERKPARGYNEECNLAYVGVLSAVAFERRQALDAESRLTWRRQCPGRRLSVQLHTHEQFST